MKKMYLLLIIFIITIIICFVDIDSYDIDDSKQSFYIDIKGDAVVNGPLEVTSDMSVSDVIKKTKISDNIDYSKINLSLKLYPEMLLIIDTIKEDKLISINGADLKELCLLPGIKEGYAKRIIDYRNNNGPILNLEDLKKVKGIGDKKYEKLKAYICL